MANPNEKPCSKSGLLRILDTVILTVFFLLQNVCLNFIIIEHHSESIFSFLWFLADFFCLTLFSFTIFLAHRYHRKQKQRNLRAMSRVGYQHGEARSISPQGSRVSEQSFFGRATLPVTYVSWIFYATIMIMKITLLFKSGIVPQMPKTDTYGPQVVKFCIGLSTIIFSLLVESHHNASDEPLRNAYLNSLAFGVALEILDSVSFLTLLIPVESHLAVPYDLENCVIALAGLNLLLPAVTIYKISASDFGRVYHVPLETIYKFLHVVLINLPFLGVRIYLWQAFSTDTAIFAIKNLYAILAFLRGAYTDIKLLQAYIRQRAALKNLPPPPGPSGGGAVTASRQSNGGLPARPRGGSSANGSPSSQEAKLIYRNENSTPPSSREQEPGSSGITKYNKNRKSKGFLGIHSAPANTTLPATLNAIAKTLATPDAHITDGNPPTPNTTASSASAASPPTPVVSHASFDLVPAQGVLHLPPSSLALSSLSSIPSLDNTLSSSGDPPSGKPILRTDRPAGQAQAHSSTLLSTSPLKINIDRGTVSSPALQNRQN